jgi:hypothetical protein
MKKLLLVPVIGLSLIAGASYAEPVKDTSDLIAFKKNIYASIAEFQRIRKANHSDMGGHAAKIEALLKQVDYELGQAITVIEKAK